MANETQREKAYEPEDIGRLLLSFAQTGDFAGIRTLFEDDAVLALPPGDLTTGNKLIADVFAARFSDPQGFDTSDFEQQPALRCGDLALTSTRVKGGRTTAEVARRQADGTWRWVIDQPNIAG